MSDLFCLGMSFKTSPVELRERLAVDAKALPEHLGALRQVAGLPEAVLLATCNRVEVYAGHDAPSDRALAAVRQWLSERAGESVDPYLYTYQGLDAVRHAYRVASSLDSMVVGEPQILGQVKEAYGTAKQSGAVGALLDRAFTTAFSVAKKVRRDTEIAEGSVSISSIAGDLATKIFGDLEGRRVLLVGAGEMGEAAAKHLRKAGAALYVVNRSREKADVLAQTYGGQARGLAEMASELAMADVAIASTSSTRFVITAELMRGVVKARRHRPLFLIDIAVPRDVDPRVGEMDNIFVYDVDDLEQAAAQNIGHRRRAADKAEQIVGLEVEAFAQWRRAGDVKPTIVGLRNQVRGVLAAELERTLPRLPELSGKQRKSLDKMVDAMTNKLLHHAVSELKASAGQPDGQLLAESVKRLFDLKDGSDAPAPEGESAREANRESAVRERLLASGGRSG
jgi:glutamyl-tRNA reductase